MTREALRLLWDTITSSWRRKSTPDEPRPGDDNQWSTWPRIRIADYLNPEDQADEEDRRSTP